MIDEEVAFAAMETRDPRFDGWFYVGVATTGIYCRPSCPAVMPKRQNVRLFPSAHAAQAGGFRACKRCRPDAAPGSPEWNLRTDLAARAMRLIADGVVDREGVAGLCRRLGYSERQVHRQLVAEVGAGAQALARAQRARTARMLLESSGLPVSDVAFAAGFASIRQFNVTMRQAYGSTPSAMRGDRRVPSGVIALRLAFRPPMDVRAMLDRLGSEGLPGIEEYNEGYTRSLDLPHAPGVVTLTEVPGAGHVGCELRLDDLRDLAAAVRRCRRLLDLDADQHAIDAFLAADPRLGPSVAARPGLRVPGHVDPHELAVRTVLGERASKLVERYGRPLPNPIGTVTHTFPDLATLAKARLDDDLKIAEPLVEALVDGSLRLDEAADPHQAGKRLTDLPGLGEREVALIRMRALHDPDVRLNHPGEDRWRPWRSYAAQHLKAHGN
ncbi:DNA-3-methyladenine glycosylase 2 family protein [Nonomuraea sp. NPDC059023]|uniref:DNA-3-methyladenine glycosylase 2 family protein n=1 Tax=unclassified Nonomuraea TaxID=2593643 RepID=UPI00369D78C2